jgi:predicted nucleic acid-binding protein
MSAAELFFDTNILIYHNTDQDLRKQAKAGELLEAAIVSQIGGISAQVVQECLNVMTGRLEVQDPEVDRYIASVLRPLYRLDTTAELIESAVDVKRRWRYSFYDSLVIAAALACGAKTLYSEDLQHGQRIENLTIVNPFI